MKYKIRLKKTEEGFSVWCLGLPGCWSQGVTEEEALENIKDAIRTYLETNVVLKPAGKSFERGWTEVINNKVFPLEQLFETEHEEYKVPPVDIIQI